MSDEALRTALTRARDALTVVRASKQTEGAL